MYVNISECKQHHSASSQLQTDTFTVCLAGHDDPLIMDLLTKRMCVQHDHPHCENSGLHLTSGNNYANIAVRM